MQELNFRRKRKRQRRKPRSRIKKNNLHFENRRRGLHFERRKGGASRREVLIWALQILGVCAAAALLVAFFGQRVSNAGDSMSPAIENGEVVLVNRLIYDIAGPARGDVVAFRPDGNENAHYSIKRVVGLPGETVQIKDGSVYIDGEKMEDHIFVSEIDFAGVAGEPVELKENEYFVVGDNCGASDDSRLADVGNISRDDIYGQVWFVVSFGENFGFVKD